MAKAPLEVESIVTMPPRVDARYNDPLACDFWWMPIFLPLLNLKRLGSLENTNSLRPSG